MRGIGTAGTVVLVTLAVLLGGCTSVPDPVDPSDTLPADPPASIADPIDLVNLWRVSEAEGTGPDSWLRLDGRELIAWTDCGVTDGAWRASGDLFIAVVYGMFGAGTCLGGTGTPDASLDWLLAATSFQKTDEGIDLLSRDGAVVARLSIDGNPPTSADYIDDFTHVPEVTDEVRALFPSIAALPGDATPVTATDLLGRWQPLEVGGFDPPFVEFEADGTWNGSDGCNGMAGRWLLGDDGHFLATGGPSTLIGCLNSPAPSWLSGTSLIGMVGDELTLYDASGTELGVLVRG
jgi:hypothetical protein